MQINVTEKHIENGKKRNCQFCPIALAIGEHLEEGFECHVSRYTLKIYPASNQDLDSDFCLTEVNLPQECSTFIGLFDNYDPVKPFTFEANIPTQYLK
jgi:hypothetical protein